MSHIANPIPSHAAPQRVREASRRSEPAIWWGDAEYELRERAYAPIHHKLIERLDPRPGERILDLACGLGAVAAQAARAGAKVTGIDLAPRMIERARRRPEPVDWELGDCQSLPFEDESFDAVVSSFGVIFASDPQRAARELSRVCRGRVVITAWIADPGRDLWEESPGTGTASRIWSSETGAARLLSTFDLHSEEGVWWLQGRTGEEIWSWVVRTSPPARARLRQLTATQIRRTRSAWIRRYETFRVDGVIRIPHMYLLSTGYKRP